MEQVLNLECLFYRKANSNKLKVKFYNSYFYKTFKIKLNNSNVFKST